ncbi:MAG: hypothetical protein CFH21_00297 [Alphaproteobacteria bacterium MarineAlpha5_Bin11]|nr:MAG: hypothetical protein CFH21_00297 [Alphaproteobacteria bacterium MarineAlpha5_Bin11]PPR50331.1 MAG: hypothetical protein CFH20_00950 [Alphaproteobacteria bacterium MarineAlpha5_Bin10]
MDYIREIEDHFKNYFSDDNSTVDKINFLENIRYTFIEKIKEIPKSKELFKEFSEKKYNKNKYEMSIRSEFVKKDIIVNKLKSKSDTLEIVISGKKNYKVYDLVDQKRYLIYAAKPVQGIVYSEKTYISSKTQGGTLIIVITLSKEIKE